MLSLHCQSQGFGQTQHASWHWNAIITGMFSWVWDVQAVKRGERTMAVSSWACHHGRCDWHMLGWITGASVDGGLPWDFQPSACWNPPKNWVRLRFGSAPSPFCPSASAGGREGSGLRPSVKARAQAGFLTSLWYSEQKPDSDIAAALEVAFYIGFEKHWCDTFPSSMLWITEFLYRFLLQG